MNYSTTNSSRPSSVAPGVGHFLLFPAPHCGAFVAFCTLFKLISAYIPGWRGWGLGVYFDWCITVVVLFLSWTFTDAKNLQNKKRLINELVTWIKSKRASNWYILEGGFDSGWGLRKFLFLNKSTWQCFSVNKQRRGVVLINSSSVRWTESIWDVFTCLWRSCGLGL